MHLVLDRVCVRSVLCNLAVIGTMTIFDNPYEGLTLFPSLSDDFRLSVSSPKSSE